MSGRQQHFYSSESPSFPPDFPERLCQFVNAAGLSWRELARRLGVNVRTVHRWRNGTTPDAGHLFALLELANEMDLIELLLPCLTEAV